MRVYFFFVCQVEDYQNILKLSCRPPAFMSYKAFFFKKNKRSATSFPASFSEKYTSCYILLPDKTSFSDRILWDTGQCVYCNCLLIRMWNQNFWSWPYLSNVTCSSCFYTTKRSRQKFKYFDNKTNLRWNKKHFPSFLKGFHRRK